MKSKTKGGRKNAKICKKRIQSRKNMRRRRRKRVYKQKGGNMTLIMSGIAAGVLGVGIYAYSKSKKSFEYMPLEKLGLLQKGGANCDPCKTCQITVMDKKAKVTVAISQTGLVYNDRVIPWKDVLYDDESLLVFTEVFTETRHIIIPYRQEKKLLTMSLVWCNTSGCSSANDFIHFHKCIARTKLYKIRTTRINDYIKRLNNTLKKNPQTELKKSKPGLKQQLILSEQLNEELKQFAMMATDAERKQNRNPYYSEQMARINRMLSRFAE